jgi:hypothetical protein
LAVCRRHGAANDRKQNPLHHEEHEGAKGELPFFVSFVLFVVRKYSLNLEE